MHMSLLLNHTRGTVDQYLLIILCIEFMSKIIMKQIAMSILKREQTGLTLENMSVTFEVTSLFNHVGIDVACGHISAHFPALIHLGLW